MLWGFWGAYASWVLLFLGVCGAAFVARVHLARFFSSITRRVTVGLLCAAGFVGWGDRDRVRSDEADASCLRAFQLLAWAPVIAARRRFRPWIVARGLAALRPPLVLIAIGCVLLAAVSTYISGIDPWSHLGVAGSVVWLAAASRSHRNLGTWDRRGVFGNAIAVALAAMATDWKINDVVADTPGKAGLCILVVGCIFLAFEADGVLAPNLLATGAMLVGLSEGLFVLTTPHSSVEFNMGVGVCGVGLVWLALVFHHLGPHFYGGTERAESET